MQLNTKKCKICGLVKEFKNFKSYKMMIKGKKEICFESECKECQRNK